MKKNLCLALVTCIAYFLSSCTSNPEPDSVAPPAKQVETISILTGSESEPLRPLVEQFARSKGVQIRFESKGAVDIMLGLKNGEVPYDAIWPSNSMWVTLSGNSVVKDGQSIMRTPVVLWVKKSTAQELGWVGKPVKVQKILDASQSGKLSMLATSATQSNSGASAYFGFLNAFSGQPKSLTEQNLSNTQVREKIKRFYSNIKHSFGSSKWLKDYFVDHYQEYNAMINYESMGIEANQALVQSGREPLYAIYPVDGLAIADCPLYYADHGSASKREFVKSLQAYLKSPEAQQKIMKQGWRVGEAGLGNGLIDASVFNSEWGIDTARVIQPIRFPNASIIEKALSVYQTVLRRPIARAYCLDFSGSMEGEGQRQVKHAMQLILDPDEAAKHFLQMGPEDITLVITFDDQTIHQWVVKGNDPKRLRDLNANVQAEQARGGTDIYSPVENALAYFQKLPNLEGHMVSVELMTDGQSNAGSLESLMLKRQALRQKVPVYTIGFGDADAEQLKSIAQKTEAKYFDGKGDLVKTFREVSGYN